MRSRKRGAPEEVSAHYDTMPGSPGAEDLVFVTGMESDPDLERALTALEPWEGHDSTPTELAFLRRALGPQLEALGAPLESHADIDRVAAMLLGRFGI